MRNIDNLFININIPSADLRYFISVYDELIGRNTRFIKADLNLDSNKFLSIPVDKINITIIESIQNLKSDFNLKNEQLIGILVSSGEINITYTEDRLSYRRGEMVIFNSLIARNIEILAGTKFCILTVKVTDITFLLTELNSSNPHRDLRIATSFDIRSDRGQMLAAMLAAIVTGLSDSETRTLPPRTAYFLQAALLGLILEKSPDPSTNVMARERRNALPLQIRRAIDYIVAHAAEDIAISDVARAAGIGLRTLQQNFRRFLHASPQEYIRTIKLRHARRDLEDPQSQISVEDIARKWGFSNRGHFAAQYRELYGELPSKTRKGR